MENKRRSNRFCAWVKGNIEDLDRKNLYREFGKFGKVKKIYVNQKLSYAKVYFDDEDIPSLEYACKELNNSQNLQVKFCEDSFTQNPNKKFIESEDTDSNNSRMNYDDDFDFDTVTIVYDEYVDVHGRPLTVLEGGNCELFIRLKDIKKTGFSIFRKDNYHLALGNKKQILKEFEMHLLTEGRNYLLHTRANLNEDDILQTIERCKNKLLNDAANVSKQKQFGQERTLDHSGGKITITSTDFSQGNVTSKVPVAPFEHNRSPKQLPPKFGATHRHHPLSPNQNHTPDNRRNFKENKNNTAFNGYDPNNTQKPQNMRKPAAIQEKEWERFGAKPKSDDDSGKRQAEVKNSSKNKQEESWEGESKSSKVENKVTPNHNVSSEKIVPNDELVNDERNSMQKAELDMSCEQMVRVSHIYKGKDNIYFVQPLKNMDVVDNLLVEANEAAVSQPEMTPIIGKLCLALFEELWYRAYIVNIKDNVSVVDLIDYGNREYIKTPLKVLPEALKKIPIQAVRVSISNDQKVSLNVEDEFNLKGIKLYDDGTYIIKVLEEKVETPLSAPVEKKPINFNDMKLIEVKKPNAAPEEEPCYLGEPKPLTNLTDGDKVMLIGHMDSNFILRTKECCGKCKELHEYIEKLEEKRLSDVKVNQMVLCTKEGIPGLHRAIITERNDSSVKVSYIDYTGSDSLMIKSLRNVDLHLSKEPRALINSPKCKYLENLGKSSTEYLKELVETRKKCVVVFDGEKFDLKLDDNTLVSEKLYELDNPKKVEPEAKPEPVKKPVDIEEEKPKVPIVEEKSKVSKSTPSAEEKVTYDNMEWVTPQKGQESYMCYSVKDVTEVTLLSTKSEDMEYLAQLMEIVVEDKSPYEPEVFEMVLASYKGPEEEEASWYRGVVTEHNEKNGEFMIMFVDYGNTESLKKDDLRKFPRDLMKIPMLGISAYFDGIPNKPEIVERLQKLIPDGDIRDVIIKGALNDEMKYPIEIPAVYELLKKEGLC